MLWWVVGIVAAWVVLGAAAAVWIGRAISHTKLEEAAAELRRAEEHKPGAIRAEPACPWTKPLKPAKRARR